jgi:hypothetical protein
VRILQIEHTRDIRVPRIQRRRPIAASHERARLAETAMKMPQQRLQKHHVAKPAETHHDWTCRSRHCNGIRQDRAACYPIVMRGRKPR